MKIKTQQKKKKETLIVKPIDVRTRAKTNTLISSRPFIHYKHDNKKIIIIRRKKKDHIIAIGLFIRTNIKSIGLVLPDSIVGQ